MDLVEGFEFHRRTLERLGRSPTTLALYRTYEQQFLLFLEEGEIEPSFDALTPQLVYEAQGWLRTRSRGHRSGVVAERMFNTVLRTFDRWAVDNDLYLNLRLGRLKKPTVPKIKRKPFAEAEAKRLIQAAAEGPNPLRDRALLLLLFDTGCRIGELCGVSLDDLDLTKGSILFRQTKSKRPREVVFRVADRRDGGPSLQAVRQWLRVREAEPGEQALFTTRERHGLSPRRAREIFAQLGRAARVPNCHPHRCRHTAATEFLAERPGAEIQLRSRLGHVSRDVLQDYVTISDPTAEQAASVASVSRKWSL
jgi:integrase/recombinase XerD